jgi:DNA-binding transcriptional LysR family regulator
MIDVRHFKHMVALAREMHFTTAAKLLNIAQPALSQSIRQLERELGVQLFNRNTRDVSLTPAGKVFYREALRTLQSLDNAVQATLSAARGEQGTVSIGYSTAAMLAYMPSILKRFDQQYPSIGMVFTEYLTDDAVVDALRQSQIDIGCIQRCLRVDTLDYFLLNPVPVVVALNRKHRLAHASSVSLKDLAGEPFVVPTRTRYNYLPYGSIPRIWKKAGISPRHGAHAESPSAVLGMVAANLGVCVMHDPLNLSHPDVVTVKIADFHASLPMQILWRKEAYTQEIASFVECARQEPSTNAADQRKRRTSASH